MLSHLQKLFWIFSLSTLCLIAGCALTKINRGSGRYPDPTKMKFTIDSDSYGNINKLSIMANIKLIQDVLGYFDFHQNLTNYTEWEKNVINTDFIDIGAPRLKIDPQIKGYKDNFVFLMLSIELTNNGENVRVLWRYAVCRAPYKSSYWIYDKIPIPVRNQVKNEIVKKVFKEFVKRVNLENT